MAKHNGYVGNIVMTYEGVKMTGIKFPFDYITQKYAIKKMKFRMANEISCAYESHELASKKAN